MADTRLPLLRGKITSVDTFEAPQGGGGTPPRMPSLDPRAHITALTQQLDTIAEQVKARTENARDELAKREIVAVRPASNAQLVPDQLDDARADARLVGVMPDTGTVVLDVASADLEYLRKKLDAFADDSKVKTKTEDDGTVTTHRGSEKAIAPVGSIGLAEIGDLSGAQLRAEAPPADRACWFEVGCRGGYRNPEDDTTNSRAQIARQLHRLGASQKLDEFRGPEQVYFFIRLTSTQLDELRKATDCVYEVELAPQPLRDLMLLDDLVTKDIADFALGQPREDAPSVVVLDTGSDLERDNGGPRDPFAGGHLRARHEDGGARAASRPGRGHRTRTCRRFALAPEQPSSYCAGLRHRSRRQLREVARADGACGALCRRR
jgi:hypothetical protein